ncbi:MAG: acyltransferase family protein [Isosphaerales bacterium]
MPSPVDCTGLNSERAGVPDAADRAVKSGRWPRAASWRRDLRQERPPSLSPAFYPGLDLLRGFAAITVVVYHVIEHFQWKGFPTGNPLALWFRLGWMGVDLFFVISGFVIALSAFNLLERDRSRYARDFCRRRLARIVPLHYLTCLIFVLFLSPSLLFAGNFYRDALTHLSFTHNFHWVTNGSINGPNWSLGVEMQFYLLILLAAPLVKRMKPMVLLAICVGVAWTWRAWVFAACCGEVRHGVIMTWFGVAQLPGFLDEFGMGIVLALVLHHDTEGRLDRFLRANRWLWLVAAAALGSLTMRLYWQDSAFWGNWTLVVFWRTLLGATFLLIVISVCAISNPWFLRLTAPMRYLGTISYGIYLWHMLVLLSLKPLLMAHPGRACRWTVGLTLVLAALSWHFFEKPMLDRFSGRRVPAREATRCEE